MHAVELKNATNSQNPSCMLIYSIVKHELTLEKLQRSNTIKNVLSLEETIGNDTNYSCFLNSN